MNYTLCKHCDHFVEIDDYSEATIHLEDGEQNFDHEPELSDQSMPLEEWKKQRPDLFVTHEDGAIGPNSTHHSQRGKYTFTLVDENQT